VRDGYRGYGVGVTLLEKALKEATRLGYTKIRLDVIPTLGKAKSLYISFGFYEIPAYFNNPVNGTIYMERLLETGQSNPWNSIPLVDYEHHMEHSDVVQSQLLNELTKKYLQKLNPASPLFLRY
jgi:hypothetical protein